MNKLDDPNSTYNKKVLADLRQKYPDMTMEELISERKKALATLRENLKGKLDDIPLDDYEFIGYMKRLGVKP